MYGSSSGYVSTTLARMPRCTDDLTFVFAPAWMLSQCQQLHCTLPTTQLDRAIERAAHQLLRRAGDAGADMNVGAAESKKRDAKASKQQSKETQAHSFLNMAAVPIAVSGPGCRRG